MKTMRIDVEGLTSLHKSEAAFRRFVLDFVPKEVMRTDPHKVVLWVGNLDVHVSCHWRGKPVYIAWVTVKYRMDYSGQEAPSEAGETCDACGDKRC